MQQIYYIHNNVVQMQLVPYIHYTTSADGDTRRTNSVTANK